MIRIIAGLLAAAAFLPAADRILVVHKQGDSVGEYNASSGKLLWTAPVGKIPHEFALTADGKRLYVTNYGLRTYTDKQPGGNTISIIDLKSKKNVGQIDLGQYHRPHGIERARNGHFYVTTDLPASVLEVDPVQRKIVRALDVGQELPHMVQLSVDETKLWTANAGSGSVTSLSLTNPGQRKTINVGGVPMGFALSPDGKRLFVTTRSGNEVVVIDTETDSVATRVDVEGEPVRMALTTDGGLLAVTCIASGEMAVLETVTFRERKRIKIGARAEGITFDVKRGAGYASAQADNKVVKFSLKDWSVIKQIPAAAPQPDPIIVLH
jgi:YVTN family beta-propeller protein